MQVSERSQCVTGRVLPSKPRLVRGVVASTRRRQRLPGDGLTSLGGSVSGGSGVGSGGGSGRSGCRWTGAPCSCRWRTGDRGDMWGVGAHGGGLCSYGLRYPFVWVYGCDRGHRFDVTRLVEAVSIGDYTGLPRQLTACGPTRKRGCWSASPASGDVDRFAHDPVGYRVVTEGLQRTHQDVVGHPGRKGDPLYDIRRPFLVREERLSASGRRALGTPRR